jgi:hypothetical protein
LNQYSTAAEQRLLAFGVPVATPSQDECQSFIKQWFQLLQHAAMLAFMD